MSKINKLITLFFIIFLISCNGKEKTADEINISVSITPFADLTRQIVGNRANVNTLIPPGINVHSFEPSPQDLKGIFNSDIFFKVGASLDLEVTLLPKIAKDISKISDCSNDIELLNNNPHYWLSPKNAKIITKNILDELIRSYPQHKNYFTNNRNKLIDSLSTIDSTLTEILSHKNDRTLLVYHPAWTYFTEQYHLEEISIEKDGKSPRAKDLTNIIKLAKQKGVTCIFFDPHFDETSVATIASSLGLEIDSIDPLPENYLENLNDIANKLKKYLK